MKNITTFILSFVFVVTSLFAQHRGDSGINIYVEDRVDRTPLIGAHISIASIQDSLTGVTTKTSNGFIVQALFHSTKIFNDSVDLNISYVGYKSFHRRYSPKELEVPIYIDMTEDPLMISQIVVTGDRVAMIIKGDTTIYDAAVFKTMQGDRFAELLKQLPGIEIKNNKILADGEEIKRVYVDGRNLFGTNTSYTLTDIRADDVKNVRVYEEDNPNAVRVGDVTAPKDKVMDVVTHSKRNVIKGGSLSLIGGVSLEKDYSGEREVRHTEIAELYRNAETGNLRFEVLNSKNDGSKDNNSVDSKITPSEKSDIYARHEYRRGDSTTIGTYAKFLRSHTKKIESSITDYLPTEEYSRRIISSMSDARSKEWNLDANNNIAISRKKQYFMSDFSVTGSRNKTANYTELSQEIDNNRVITVRDDNNRTDNLRLDLSANYTTAITPKTSLMLAVRGIYSKLTGDMWNIDTLASEQGLRLRLNNDIGANNKSAVAAVTLKHTVDKKSALALSYTYAYDYNKSRQLSLNLLDNPNGVIDAVNSYDYTINSHLQEVETVWEYDNDNNVRGRIAVVGGIYDVRNAGKLPQKDNSNHIFYHLNPKVRFSFGKPKNRLNAEVVSVTSPLSVEMLRNSIDVSNPMFIQAGNPNLKPTNHYNFALNYSTTKAEKSRTLRFGISGNYIFNQIAEKRIVYMTETYVPEYKYTFQKGAQLTSRVNVDGAYRIGTSFEYSQKVKSIRSTLRASVNYYYQQIPYYVGESLETAGRQEANIVLRFNSGFSEKIKVGLSSTTGLANHETESGKYQYIRETVNGDIDIRFAKRYFVSAKAIYEIYANSSASVMTENYLFANAAIGCRFGKDNNASISAGVVDLFNQTSVATTKIFSDYIYTYTTSYLGRYAYLTIAYTF